jgi:hypothetical protein
MARTREKCPLTERRNMDALARLRIVQAAQRLRNGQA